MVSRVMGQARDRGRLGTMVSRVTGQRLGVG